jgi:hypothetical protein
MLQSTLVALIEAWMAREVPDEILADGMEEYGAEDYAKRLRSLHKHKGKRRDAIESRLVHDVAYKLPRMRADAYARRKGRQLGKD